MEAARKLELAAAAGDLSDAPSLLARIETEAERAGRALRALPARQADESTVHAQVQQS
jgi:hypothetical protein